MANVVQAEKKIALLHRYPKEQISETNAAFPYLAKKGMDVLTFKKFNRLSSWKKFLKSVVWIFYAPLLVLGRGYDVIYCDDSYPFYPILVKLASPRSKVILRIGDFHLMYYYKGLIYFILHTLETWGWFISDRIIVISETMREKVALDLYYFSCTVGEGWEEEIKKKIHVVLDPVELWHTHLRRKKSRGSVMFHGVLTKNKNVDILLEAARRLPKVIFIVIGDGPDRQRLESLAPPNVIFKGWVPFHKIPHAISSCAIGLALRSGNPGNEYVLTSPFLQYGMMGKPCLVTRRKVYGDYEWQFSDVGEMVEKIKILLTRPEEGKKLRKYIVENHDAKKIGDQIWSLLCV